METRNRGQGTRGAPDAQVGTETAQTRSSAWEALAASPEFRRLISAKRNFIIPAVIFFLIILIISLIQRRVLRTQEG